MERFGKVIEAIGAAVVLVLALGVLAVAVIAVVGLSADLWEIFLR